MSHARLWLLVAILATLTWPLSVVAQPLDSALTRPAAGRDVVVVASDFPSLDALNANPLFAPQIVLDFIFTRAVKRDSAGKPFPEGVESLPSVKAGTWEVDGERMTLKWRIKARKWHDGRPVTCGDYVFAHNVARDERVRATDPITRRIAHVACPKGESSREVVVTWRERYVWANLIMTEFGAVPRHLLESYYRTNPARLRDAPYGRDAATAIGDGPYRVVEFRRGVSFTLEAVPDHPIFGTPKIKRTIWRRVARDEILPLLRSGVADIAYPGLPSLGQLQELAGLPPDRFQVLFESGAVWEHINFNLSNPLLQDLRVRQAIAHGINRTLIVQQIYKGRVVPSHTIFGPNHPGFTDAVQRYPYDPSRARALLQQAGFAPGPDGVMRNAAGQRLSLEITTTSDGPAAPVRDLVELMIQQQLSLVGIEVTILNFPFRQFFGLIMQRRQFRALALYGWVLDPTSDCYKYTSRDIPSEANGWQGLNFPGYENSEIDRLCTAILQEIDESQRTSMLRRAVQILARDLPALPLYFRPYGAAAKAGLENFKLGYPCAVECIAQATWNSHQWAWR